MGEGLPTGIIHYIATLIKSARSLGSMMLLGISSHVMGFVQNPSTTQSTESDETFTPEQHVLTASVTPLPPSTARPQPSCPSSFSSAPRHDRHRLWYATHGWFAHTHDAVTMLVGMAVK